MTKVCVQWDMNYLCYDVELFDREATVADFEEACNKIYLNETKKQLGKRCIGCPKCCSGRIPITAIDLLRYQGGEVGKELSLANWLAQYADIEYEGKCVDISLKTDHNQLCLFWEKENGRCSVYKYRSLACRTYICTPMSVRLEELRSELINKGEDELVRLINTDTKSPYKSKNTFSDAGAYEQVKLRNICSRKLWNDLNCHGR
jgi:Fe-S-cluster containining protein